MDTVITDITIILFQLIAFTILSASSTIILIVGSPTKMETSTSELVAEGACIHKLPSEFTVMNGKISEKAIENSKKYRLKLKNVSLLSKATYSRYKSDIAILAFSMYNIVGDMVVKF